MKVRDFEESIWQKNRIRVVIRAPRDAEVGGYDYVNAASGTKNIRWFREHHIEPYIRDYGYEYAIIAGWAFADTDGGNLVQTVRESYAYGRD